MKVADQGFRAGSLPASLWRLGIATYTVLDVAEMVEKIYMEFRKMENGKKVGMECLGRHFDYGDRVEPSDLGLSINAAEEMAAKSNGSIKIIKKK